MSRTVKIIDPKQVTDIVYYRSVTVEYEGVEYTFNEEESDNGANYFCSIDGTNFEEINFEFDNDIARELCDKVFDAYREGIVEDNSICEFDID